MIFSTTLILLPLHENSQQAGLYIIMRLSHDENNAIPVIPKFWCVLIVLSGPFYLVHRFLGHSFWSWLLSTRSQQLSDVLVLRWLSRSFIVFFRVPSSHLYASKGQAIYIHRRTNLLNYYNRRLPCSMSGFSRNHVGRVYKRRKGRFYVLKICKKRKKSFGVIEKSSASSYAS